MIRLFKIFLILSSVWICSCQTGGVTVEQTPLGLSEIRRVLVASVGEIRTTGRGGSEFIFQYHDKDLKTLENPEGPKERFYPVVAILGDRRPYDLRVQVYVERKNGRRYEAIGQNDVMAKAWAVRIREAMYESRDKRNVIDDFKAF